VNVGGAELTWHAVDTKNYNVNPFHLARALEKKTSDVLFWAVTIVDSPREIRGARFQYGFGVVAERARGDRDLRRPPDRN
jgi:hypothetical protein